MLKNLLDRNALDEARAEDLRKLNELLQKQPKDPFEKPITWPEPEPAHKPE